MDPLSNTKKPSLSSMPSPSSSFMDTFNTYSQFPNQSHDDMGNSLDQYNISLAGKHGEVATGPFDLEAVSRPYQRVIEFIFILSSLLALLFNITALLLIFRRHRRSTSCIQSLHTTRVCTRQLSCKELKASRKKHITFGSSQIRIYLINLFVNDILIALFTTPLNYTDFLYGQWIFPPILCPVTNFVSVCAVSVSVYTLIAIGLERYAFFHFFS